MKTPEGDRPFLSNPLKADRDFTILPIHSDDTGLLNFEGKA